MEQEKWIGIRREDKSVWERRVPLIPSDIKEILSTYPNIRIVVQPSKKRIFSDPEYEEAGAILDEDLSKCSLILGIKEVPIEKLIPGKTFVYFSHTIKVIFFKCRHSFRICPSSTLSYRKISDLLTTRRSLTKKITD
jgi:hypothetical protein